MKRYNEIIQELREDRDYTQEKIAKILNTSQSNYSKYEKGIIQPSIDQIIKLCIFYNISPEYILGFTNTPNELPKK